MFQYLENIKDAFYNYGIYNPNLFLMVIASSMFLLVLALLFLLIKIIPKICRYLFSIYKKIKNDDFKGLAINDFFPELIKAPRFKRILIVIKLPSESFKKLTIDWFFLNIFRWIYSPNSKYLLFANSKYFSIILPLIISFFIFLFITHFGNLQFPGMDGSILVNAGWQYYLGYQPYKDFITMVPPGFLIGVKLAFSLFGITWNSIVIITAIFAVITFVAQLIILLRLNVSIVMSSLLSFAIQVLTNLSASFWWYNHVTSVSSALFISSAFLFYKNPKNITNNFILFFTTSLLVLMKPNTAGFLSISIFIIFFITKSYRARSIFIVVGAAIFTIILFFFTDIDLRYLVQTYLNGSSRFDFFYVFNNIFFPKPSDIEASSTLLLMMPFIFGILMLIDCIISNRLISILCKKYLNSILFVLVGMGTTLIGIGTNTEYNLVDLPVFLISIFILTILLKNEINLKKSVNSLNFNKIILIFNVGLIVLLFSTLEMGINRERIAASGDFYKIKETKIYKNNSNFLKNFYSSSYFSGTLNDMDRLINAIDKNMILDYKVHFGPRVNFGYAMFNIKPSKGFPLWWGESAEIGGVPRGKTPSLIRKFKEQKFKLIIMLKNNNDIYDFTYYPLEIEPYLNQNYVVHNMKNIVIYINPSEKLLISKISKLK